MLKQHKGKECVQCAWDEAENVCLSSTRVRNVSSVPGMRLRMCA